MQVQLANQTTARIAAPGETFIRPATPHDVDGIVALGLEALEKDAYEGLRISKERVREATVEIISGQQHFLWVGDRDGEIVASVAAFVGPMSFYERNQASIVQFYSKVPGVGIKLLRECLRWCRGRRAIKSIVFTLEHNADPRIGKMLTRMGLTEILPIYMEVTG